MQIHIACAAGSGMSALVRLLSDLKPDTSHHAIPTKVNNKQIKTYKDTSGQGSHTDTSDAYYDKIRPTRACREQLECIQTTRAELTQRSTASASVSYADLEDLIADGGHVITKSDKKWGDDHILPEGTQLLVISSAMKDSHSLIVQARAQNIPILHRIDMVKILCRHKKVLAVLGSNGKTSSSGMLSSILDCSFIIGGVHESYGTNARIISGPYIVLECDESDRSFEKIEAFAGILLNLIPEHLSAYGDSFDNLEQALKDYCLDQGIIVCDKGLCAKWGLYREYELLDRTEDSFTYSGLGYEFGVQLKVFGRHMIENAGAVVTLCLKLGISPEQIKVGLSNFAGMKKRLSYKGFICIEPLIADLKRGKYDSALLVQSIADESGPVIRQDINSAPKLHFIDDYAHNTAKIAASLNAVRAKYEKAIVLFEPHNLKRFIQTRQELGKILIEADGVIVSPLYDGSLSEMQSCDHSARFADEFGFKFAPDSGKATESLLLLLQNELRGCCTDLVLVGMGAGDSTLWVRKIYEALQAALSDVHK